MTSAFSGDRGLLLRNEWLFPASAVAGGARLTPLLLLDHGAARLIDGPVVRLTGRRRCPPCRKTMGGRSLCRPPFITAPASTARLAATRHSQDRPMTRTPRLLALASLSRCDERPGRRRGQHRPGPTASPSAAAFERAVIAARAAGQADTPALRKQLAQQLVAEELFWQEARKQKLHTGEEADRAAGERAAAVRHRPLPAGAGGRHPAGRSRLAATPSTRRRPPRQNRLPAQPDPDHRPQRYAPRRSGWRTAPTLRPKPGTSRTPPPPPGRRADLVLLPRARGSRADQRPAAADRGSCRH